MARVTRSRYEIVDGGLRRDGELLPIPKGLLYFMLARTGWKGKDGPLAPDFVRRLREQDPRLSLLYLRPDLESAA